MGLLGNACAATPPANARPSIAILERNAQWLKKFLFKTCSSRKSINMQFYANVHPDL
jgi:hypothetical protein